MIRSSVRKIRCCLAATLLFAVFFAPGCADKAENPEQLVADAKLARAEGEHNTAIIHLKNLLRESPEHAEARFLLGVSLSDINDFSSAERELRKALDLQYQPSAVMPVLGKALLMNGEFQQVLDEIPLDDGASSDARAEILTLHAMAMIGLDRGDEARDLLGRALALEPEFPDALLGKARLAASENKLDDAQELIDRTLATAPNNVDAWFMKAELSQIMGSPSDAIAAYQRVIDLSPRSIPARVKLASLQVETGDIDTARIQIEQLRNINPKTPMAAYVKAMIELREQNYSDAREAVLQVLEVVPNYMPAVLLAGAIEFASDSHVQAQTYLWQVINQTPNNLYARRLLAASLAKSGQPDRALGVIEKGLNQYPADGPLLALAGEVYLQKNDFVQAARYFEEAAKLDPDNARARTQLGLARLASGQTDYGLATLESASQLDLDTYQADILLVTSHLRQENYDKALSAMQMLEKKQPDNPLTYNLKAMIYIGKQDNAIARKNLEHALQLDTTYVPAAVNLARLDLHHNDPEAARGRIESILDEDADNVQALLALASLGPRLGATQEEQVAWLQRARDASPDSVQPRLMLARFYASAGKPGEALEAVQQAQTINPDNVQVLHTLGTIQSSTGKNEQALQTYHKLVALQPDSPVAQYGLALAQIAVENENAATSTLKKALSLQPDYIDAQVTLAVLQIRAGQLQEAATIARQIQKQDANAPQGYSLEGDVLMAQKQYSQAAKVYEKAYRIARSGELALRLHAAYTLAGKPREADRRLAQWLEQSPDDARARLYAAEQALKSGKYSTAIENYEWLIKKQPDNVVALNNIAWTYQQVGNTQAALESAERAHKLKPDDAAVADTLGWILVEQGDTARGLELLQSAVAADPGAQEIRFHLARAWLKAGETAKARSELEQLLATGGDFPQYAEAKTLLDELSM